MTHSPVVLADFCDHLTSNLPLSQDIQCVQACKQNLLVPQANSKPLTTFSLPTTQISIDNKPTYYPSTCGCQSVDTTVITCLFCYSSCMACPLDSMSSLSTKVLLPGGCWLLFHNNQSAPDKQMKSKGPTQVLYSSSHAFNTGIHSTWTPTHFI